MGISRIHTKIFTRSPATRGAERSRTRGKNNSEFSSTPRTELNSDKQNCEFACATRSLERLNSEHRISSEQEGRSEQTFDIGADVELVAAGAEVHVGGRLVHLGRRAEQAHRRRRERQAGTPALWPAVCCVIRLAEDWCFYTPVTARKNDGRNEDDRFLFLGEELTRRGQRTKRMQDDDGELPEEVEIE